MAVGAESGAVSLYNNFSTDPPSSLAAVEESLRFQKQRTVLNLTHKITTMAFHPSAEMMAIATDQVRWELCFFFCLFRVDVLLPSNVSPRPRTS